MSGPNEEDRPDERAATTGTATSRLRSGRMGVRKATKARLALSAPSGAGKTWTALSTAFVLAPNGRVIVIDTEPGDDRQGASELYADSFPSFDVIQWEPPYDPRDLTLTIREAGQMTVPDGYWPGQQGYDVIIVDSASPFWKGEGGTMDIAGGKFGGWKTASPAQDQLVNAILRTPAHIIVCTRAKQAYEVTEVMEGNAKKQKVEKLGLQPIQRDDLEYEFQVVVVMDEAHRIDIGKTRAAPLAGLSFMANDQHKFAEIYKTWLESGADPARQIDIDAIVHTFRTLPDADRQAAKDAFKAEFGDPKYLTGEQVPAVWTWIAAHRDIDEHPLAPSDALGLCGSCGMADRAPWHVGVLDAPDPEQDPAAEKAGDETDASPTDQAPDAADGDLGANQGNVEHPAHNGFKSLAEIIEHVKPMSRATVLAELTALELALAPEDQKETKLDTLRRMLAEEMARRLNLLDDPQPEPDAAEGKLGV
jgi:hypothetical protein